MTSSQKSRADPVHWSGWKGDGFAGGVRAVKIGGGRLIRLVVAVLWPHGPK